jgi:hypothetical protein
LAQNGAAQPGSIAAQVLKIADDYTAIALQHQLKIDAELTADQKVQWETFKLHRFIDARLTSLGLTSDQNDKIGTLIGDTAKAITALTDSADIQPLTGRLYRKIIADVLTEPQAAKMAEDTSTLPDGGRVIAAGGVVIGNVGGAGMGNLGAQGGFQGGPGGGFGGPGGQGGGPGGGRGGRGRGGPGGGGFGGGGGPGGGFGGGGGPGGGAGGMP